MNRKTIAIIFGGQSTEYEVSLQSAASVIDNLNTDKYHIILLGITKEGRWLRFNGDTNQIRTDTWHTDFSCIPAIISPDRSSKGLIVFDKNKTSTISIDVAFPIMHGKYGEDGSIQGLLEMAGIPYVGCGVLSSALCMDKDIAHKLVHLAGIATPASILLNTPIKPSQIIHQTAHLDFPVFVKPVNSGSSFGISKVERSDDLIEAVLLAQQFDNKVIIEEAITGFEVGCAILGKEQLVIGEVDEIELTHDFFDYEEKYTLKSSSIHMPARIDASTKQKIKDTAAAIYQILQCRGFARVDMFLTPENEIVFNEVNSIPGFTSHSRYPTMMKGIGLSFSQILDQLIELALNV